MKNNRPALRINGYSSNWDEFRMIDLVTPIVREVPKPTTSYKRLSVRSHAKGTFHQVVENPNTIAMDKLYVVHQDDLIVNITFAWEHAIAIAEEKDHDLLVSHRFPTFLINKSDVNFIKYLVTLKSFKNRLDLISPGGAGRNRVLNKKDFNNMKLFAPAQMDEQKKIGSFFKNLDDTIALHQQELEALKLTKKGFLQKMFPRDGKLIPELRFPEFITEWHSTTLNNVTNIIGGGTPDTKEPKYWDGEIDWYSPTEIGKNTYANGSARKITQLGLKKSSAKLLPANKTILFTSRAGIGDTAILIKNGATNQGFQSLVVQDNCDVYFLYSMSHKIKNYALKNASGSTFLEISGKNLGKMPVLIPTIEEQVKIGEFFRQLDEVIELKEKELEALKETKKGFLQKMFV